MPAPNRITALPSAPALLPLRTATRQAISGRQQMVQIPQAELIPTQVRMSLLGEYVDLLLQHEPFRRELDALYEEREKYPFLPVPEDDDFYGHMECGVLLYHFTRLRNACFPEEAEPQFFNNRPDEWQLYRFFKQAYAFCRRWKLPIDLWQDVLYLVRYVEDVEELHWWKKNGVLFVSLSTPILPEKPTPPMFPEYNPITSNRESYLEKVQRMANEYCEQVDQVWRTAGWRGEQAFSHYRSQQYLKRLAKQVFMRVVLGMGWGAIRNALRGEGVHIESRVSVKRVTERAIEILGITERMDPLRYLPYYPTAFYFRPKFDNLLAELIDALNPQSPP